MTELHGMDAEASIFKAKDVYVKGMAEHFPGVDPRLGLLGMQDAPYGYLYKTKAYGYDLVKIPTRKQKIIDYIVVTFYYCMLVYVGYLIGVGH